MEWNTTARVSTEDAHQEGWVSSENSPTFPKKAPLFQKSASGDAPKTETTQCASCLWSLSHVISHQNDGGGSSGGGARGIEIAQ